ncbi:MAG: iron ABC transporter permease [Bacilli bacterium]|jgi:iron complex transport system permease protein|nr:iron ABC transporter permease [Bacilli bacterium]
MRNTGNSTLDSYHRKASKKRGILFLLGGLVLVLFVASCFAGSSQLGFVETWQALFRQGDEANIRILYSIRLPRIIAALLAGAGLGVSGLIMQTTLRNPLASPSTLGVSNAAVFGANIAIIVFSQAGYDQGLSSNPYLIATFSFVFAIGSVLIILGLARVIRFSPETVILAGIGVGTLFTALTTLIQYFAVDTTLASAVYWTFGDLGRATYPGNLLLLVSLVLSLAVFLFQAKDYNALLSGDDIASSLGVNLKRVRFLSLLLASFMTAVSISLLGMIGFLGIIAPHLMKRVIGMDHKYLIPATALTGSATLIFADTLARVILPGTSLPVGAITAILGVPVFLIIIFRRREGTSLC